MHNISQQLIAQWLTHYGSIALLLLLAVGIFGLPIPEETLLVVTGLLLAKGHLPFVTTVPAAYLGSILGITSSYVLGYTLGRRAIAKFGKFLHITPERMEKAHNWYEKVGKWFLVFGYYLPGIRHLSGIFAGATYLKYWEFALFAYSGAIIWVTTFLSLGYFSYSAWQNWHFI